MYRSRSVLLCVLTDTVGLRFSHVFALCLKGFDWGCAGDITNDTPQPQGTGAPTGVGAPGASSRLPH